MLQNEKKIKRQIDILKHLSYQEIVSAEKLSLDLKIHRTTLALDIDDLNKILPVEVTITQDFRKGYLLSYPENNSIDYYIAQLAKNTLVYKIIDHLFLNVENNITDFAIEFYTSESVLLRLITHMNTVLRSYNISISKKNLTFIGEESDIRTFLFSFYRTFMDYYAAEEIDELYEHSYTKTIDGLEYSSLHQNNTKIFLWTVISRVRVLNKHYISIEKELFDLITSHESYSEYRKNYFYNLKQLRTDFHLEEFHIPETEVIWAYVVSLDCIEYVEKNEVDAKKSDLYRADFETIKSNQMASNIYQTMTTHFDLNDSKIGEFKTIIAYLININLLSKVSLNFQKVSIPLKKYIQDNYPDIYYQWCQILEEEHIELVQTQNLEDIAVTLSMLTIPIINNHMTGALNILFSFESEAGYSAVLADASQRLLLPEVHAIYAFSSAITPQFVAENKIDILVSNFKQRNEEALGCKIFRLSYLPTLTEWTQLRNKIINLLR